MTRSRQGRGQGFGAAQRSHGHGHGPARGNGHPAGVVAFGLFEEGVGDDAIAKQDEHCGELYAATYACIAALSCEDFLKWYSHPDPKLPFPCQTEETAFRTDCPDFDLYNENN